MSGGEKFPSREDVMKDFKDTTKTRSGFDFTRTTTPVRPHTRAMPGHRAPVQRNVDQTDKPMSERPAPKQRHDDTSKPMAKGGRTKVTKVMHEFKAGDLHSGSKTGPKVTNPKQAVAIALSEAKRAPMKKAEGGAVDMAQDKKTVATGVHKHERNMHPGKPLTKLARGGKAGASRFDTPLIKSRC